MNSLFASLGIESWKPVIGALILPPVPFLVLVLIGARLLLPRRGLGSGSESFAPEYGVSSLQSGSLERLRYGLWLAGQTGAPIAFSGGVGYAQEGPAAEAKVAAKIAADEFGRPIRWVESDSRDTRENAALTMALLKPAGIKHIVLVTHGYHMPRALRAFTEAAGPGMQVEAAPMGLAKNLETPTLEWLPSSAGFRDMRQLLRELAGIAAGA